jgi:hypothetical protein
MRSTTPPAHRQSSESDPPRIIIYISNHVSRRKPLISLHQGLKFGLLQPTGRQGLRPAPLPAYREVVRVTIPGVYDNPAIQSEVANFDGRQIAVGNMRCTRSSLRSGSSRVS